MRRLIAQKIQATTTAQQARWVGESKDAILYVMISDPCSHSYYGLRRGKEGDVWTLLQLFLGKVMRYFAEVGNK